jgi:hypothetical protein
MIGSLKDYVVETTGIALKKAIAKAVEVQLLRFGCQ